MKVNLVMSSSSTKFPIHVGFIHGLEEEGIEIEQAIGTSGGGLVLALVKSGWRAKDLIDKIYDIDFRSYANLGWWKYVMGYFRGFFVKNKKLLQLFDELTGKKLLKDVIKLSLIAVDLEQDKTIELTGSNYPDMPLSCAIMATICIPGFFEPIIWNNMYLVDGGVRESIGIDYITDTTYPTIVVVIRSEYVRTGLYKNLYEVWMDSLDNLFDANREKAVREGRRRDFIIADIFYNLGFNQFDVDEEQKREMIKLGYNKAKEIIKLLRR